ncbi:MAG: methyltransferase [Gemmatimonadota bacterium]
MGPGELKSGRRGAEWALAVGTAQALGILEALAEGPCSAGRLAETLALHPRGTEILLGILTDAGLASFTERGYALTGQGRARFIDRDAPDFEGDAMRLWLSNIRRWAGDLEEAVRRGGPPGDGPEPGRTREEMDSLSRFMAAMANKEPAFVEKVVAQCEARLGEGGHELSRSRVLDLGGGPGVFARAFIARGARAVLADRPEVVEHVAEAYGLGGVPGLELWQGDFLNKLPGGRFQLILLANITHIYDAETNADLLRRVAARLSPAGVVAILDFVRGASEFAGLFAVTMLLNTEAGNTYALADYETWLEGAGLARPRCLSLDADRQLLTARRT